MEDNPYYENVGEQDSKIKDKLAKFTTIKKMKVMPYKNKGP